MSAEPSVSAEPSPTPLSARPPFPRLFSPLEVGGLRLRNRIVLPAIGTNRNEAGAPTDATIAYYARRAAGGAGMLIVDGAYVSVQGRHRPNQLGIEHDGRVPGLARLIDAVHAEGVPVVLQLFHTGGLISKLSLGVQPEPVAPSPYLHPSGEFVVRGMTLAEVEDVPRQFALAAERARRTGADAIELHGAHGYLLGQFASARVNRRSDGYGGSLANRMRLCLEVVDAVRRAAGAAVPLFYRLSADEYAPEGMGLEETIPFAEALEAAGVALIDVSAGISDTDGGRRRIVPDRALGPGANVELASAIRRRLRVPVMTAGFINTPELAEAVLVAGHADLVGVGRALLRDPDWPRKARTGDADAIHTCCAGMGCVRRVIAGEIVVCTVEENLARLAPERQAEIQRRHRQEGLAALRQLAWAREPTGRTA